MTPDREPIRCSCCQPPAPGERDRREVVAWREAERIVIVARRHGRKHVAVVTLQAVAG